MKHQQAACTCTPVFSYDNPPVRSLMLDVTCPIHGASRAAAAPPTPVHKQNGLTPSELGDDFDRSAIAIELPSGDVYVEQWYGLDSSRRTGSTGYPEHYGSGQMHRDSVRRIRIRASDLCASLGIAALPAGGAAPTYADGVRAALSAVATVKYDADAEGRAWSVRDVVVPGT